MLAVGAALWPATAHAHFVLEEPENWMEQDGMGVPEKLGPCGDEGGTPTNTVTPFHAGETITITIREALFHPGHYRVALSVADRSELPPEPEVTPDNQSECGSVMVEDPPEFPILADGVLEHTAPFDSEQSFQVTLPSDVTCEHCTLQVLEFMSNHRAPCFYHHCADISISPADGAGGMSAGGASSGGMDAGGMSAGGTSAGGLSAGGMSAGGMGAGGTSAGGTNGQGAGGLPALGGSGGTGGLVTAAAGDQPGGGTAGAMQPGVGGAAAASGGTSMASGGADSMGSPSAGTPTGTTPSDDGAGCSFSTPTRRSSWPAALGAALTLAACAARRRRNRGT